MLKNEKCCTFIDYQLCLKARTNFLFLEYQHLNLTSHSICPCYMRRQFCCVSNRWCVAVCLFHVFLPLPPRGVTPLPVCCLHFSESLRMLLYVSHRRERLPLCSASCGFSFGERSVGQTELIK